MTYLIEHFVFPHTTDYWYYQYQSGSSALKTKALSFIEQRKMKKKTEKFY